MSESIVSLFWKRAFSKEYKDKVAFRELNEFGEQITSLTHLQLHEKALKFSEQIRSGSKAGDRAVLLYPAGLDFVVAILACFYAKVIAVPANPPSRNNKIQRLLSILADAEPSIILSTPQIQSQATQSPELNLHIEAGNWCVFDSKLANSNLPLKPPPIEPGSIAFLQYTSGSTGEPKGVAVSHANLLHNCGVTSASFAVSSNSVLVSWLPMFHDMGLVGIVLQCIYKGATCIALNPSIFLRSPEIWLRAIDRYRGTHSGAPNFGYEYCNRHVKKRKLDGLDLSSWKVAFCGSEPIRKTVVKQFCGQFSEFGFSPESFIPAYGMAETTLTISAPPPGGGTHFDELEEKNTDSSANFKFVADCGLPGLDTDVRIVDPKSIQECQEGCVGEIWVNSPSVAQGYWNKPEITEKSFAATMANGHGPYLRTGDLGYFKSDRLYVTGRLSDLIIIRGANFYPQDIEALVSSSEPEFVGGGAAVFSVEVESQERLVVLQELARTKIKNANYDELRSKVRRTLSEEVGINPHAIVFVKPGHVLRTSSGKIRRKGAKKAFLDNALTGVLEDFRGASKAHVLAKVAAKAVPETHQVREYLKKQVSDLLNVPPESIEVSQPLATYGMDSVVAAQIAMDIEQQYHVALPTTALFDYPDIVSIAAAVVDRIAASSSVPSEAANAAVDTHGADTVAERDVDIAIIGMAAKFPGSEDVEAFWQNLLLERDSITDVPEGRWHTGDIFWQDSFYNGSQRGGFLEAISAFDPQFFNISPREAELMDPQQRLLLQHACHAFEDAGYTDKQLSGANCGVFVGCSSSDYQRVIEQCSVPASAYTLMGNSHSIMSARIAYYLNLRGVCMAADTACSSSLLAVHMACESLRSGESKMALAAGVSVLSTPQFHALAAKSKMLSAKGRCQTFADGADGFVPSEGVGVVILKPLAQALRDGDTVHGVIKGSSSNQDGQTNGITAPSGLSQSRLQKSLYDRFNINPRDISYVEAHGTGTALGDPIEVGALTNTFREYTKDTEFCAIGSVKANIGHTLAAAGIAGLIKATLCAREGKLPGSLHQAQLNPAIDFKNSPFYTLPKTQDWNVAPNATRLAAVSSFGFSGTNVHVVVERFAAPKPKPNTQSPALFLLSAKTENALSEKVRDLQKWLAAEPERTSIYDVAYTLAKHRSQYPQRLAVVADSAKSLEAEFNAWLNSPSKRHESMLDHSAITNVYTDLSANRNLTESLQKLAVHFQAGGEIDVAATFTQPGNKLDIPRYPFAHEHYWVPVATESSSHSERAGGTPEKEPLTNANAFEDTAVNQPNIREQLQNDIVAEVCRILKLDPSRVGLKNNIREFGFDSINITELTTKLNQRYSLKVMPPQLFEHQTLLSLADFLLEEFNENIQAHYDAENKNSATTNSSVEAKSRPIQHQATPITPTNGANDEPLAIIGLSGAMPGAENLDAFWNRLMQGHDLTSEVPLDRWDWRQFYGHAGEKLGQTKVNRGGFMPNVDQFDAAFFGLSRHEANLMDPQQRLFLQAVWHAIEDAGYDPKQLAGSLTGVFCGIFTADYNELLINSGHVKEAHAITGLAHSILPNRVSYLLDLRGPSVPIDTACSSSLVALHQAVESIQQGSCKMAIVGGVHVMSSPTGFMSASRAGMLSEDGHCKTFDKRADGYARGEGVGAIVIKPLSDALKDNDCIHAVIKGSAVNHGGAASSLTSPNPEAQAEVIKVAMQRAGISPDRVNYIEAHGTGTSLGDPIEINGLKKAYRSLYLAHGLEIKQSQCAIGTVKANIGHLEAAAGIAGLMKLVLALRSKKLHGNIHLKDINPYIDLADSPFYLLRESQQWPAQVDDHGDELPRCAGISSFGFGGANAHVIVEEWPQREHWPEAEPKSSELILLSANNEAQLKQNIANLRQYLQNPEKREPLGNIAFTLQCGREHRKIRLAIACKSKQDLLTKLASINTEALPLGVWRSQESDPSHARVNDDAVASAMAQSNFEALALAWVNNANIPWQELYKNRPVQRISLPAYPFNHQRHWVPEKKHSVHATTTPAALQSKTPSEIPVMKSIDLTKHPLLGKFSEENSGVMNLDQLSANEYYFSDHVVAEQPIMPAAAIIEIMQAAASLSLGEPVTQIENLYLQLPLSPGNGLHGLQLRFEPADDNRIDLLVERKLSDNRKIAYSESQVCLTRAPSITRCLQPSDLTQRCDDCHNIDDVYALFAQVGLSYGKSFRSLRKLRSNNNEAFAHLKLPKVRRRDTQFYTLSPSLLDAALQSVCGIALSRYHISDMPLLVPSSIKKIIIHKSLNSQCVVHTTLCSEPSTKQGWSVNVDIADIDGNILVELQQLILREMPAMAKPSAQASKNNEKPTNMSTKLPHKPTQLWPKAHSWTLANRAAPLPRQTPNLQGRCLLVGGSSVVESYLSGFKHKAPEVDFIRVTPSDHYQSYCNNHYGLNFEKGADFVTLFQALDTENLPEYIVFFDAFITQDNLSAEKIVETTRRELLPLFHLCKALVGHTSRMQGRFLLCSQNAQTAETSPVHGAKVGFMKSVVQEHAKLSVSAIDTDGPISPENLLNELAIRNNTVDEILYREGARAKRCIVSWEAKGLGEPRLKHRGVYLITGGLGGIGQIVAHYLAEQFKARVVLTGRRTEDTSARVLIGEIEARGGEAIYLSADVSCEESVKKAVKEATERFGELQGVMHCAGVVRDSFLNNKNQEDFITVLAPKVAGIVNVDRATCDQPLEFFAAFSSVSGITGNMGQTDYAAANAFMDAYIAQRQVSGGGHSISFNWPFWAEGGMSIPDMVQTMVFQQTGMKPLSNVKGIAALLDGLSSDLTQVFVAEGDRTKIDEFLQPVHAAGTATTAAAAQTSEPEQPAAPTPSAKVLTAGGSTAHAKPQAIENSAAPAETRIDTDNLRLQTEKYLINMLANAVGSDEDDIQADTDFKSIGVDSFIGLQLLNDLEKIFGPLSKTLLFENFCVADLANYFVNDHSDALCELFNLQASVSEAAVKALEPEPKQQPVQEPAPRSVETAAASPASVHSATKTHAMTVAHQRPRSQLLLEVAVAQADNLTREAIYRLKARYGAESTSVGRGNFAPYIFLGSCGEGLFYCNKQDDLFVAFGYIGDDDYLADVLTELEAYASEHGLELHIIDEKRCIQLRPDAYMTTPFSVLQRVNDLANFTMEGKSMRQLRYQYARFEREGDASTREYVVGSDTGVDRSIITMIDRWADQKVMVNPYIKRLKLDIENTQLADVYRTFLTYLDGELVNVIIISSMESHGGYLMDCEFYPPEMPMGGLEFAIVNIITQLKQEDCKMFSLGVTWGASVDDQGRADVAARQSLSDLAKRAVFDGSGNLQFKNKFRPDNTQLYLLRKLGTEVNRTLEIILMIANSEQPEDAVDAAEPSAKNANVASVAMTQADRSAQLETSGCNPANIPAADVLFDLATDSWAKLERQWQHVPSASAELSQAEVETQLRRVLPFPFFVFTHCGDEAEQCLWENFESEGKRVLQNFMFPTFIYNTVNAKYRPEEITDDVGSEGYGRLLDLDLLAQNLESDAKNIAAVCIEIATNAAGGMAVPVSHLREVKTLLAGHGSIPLILDATRLLDNSCMQNHNDSEVWKLCQESCAIADIITVSLTKNFSVKRGGVVACTDYDLFERMNRYSLEKQLVPTAPELTALGLRLTEPAQLLASVRQRLQHSQQLAEALSKANIPLHHPVGWSVLIDVEKMPAFARQSYPQARFLEYLYLQTGIRAGIHCTGMHSKPPLNGLLRLAVPVGMPEQQVQAMLAAVVNMDANPRALSEFEFVSKPSGFAADVQARYRHKDQAPVSNIRSSTVAKKFVDKDEIAIIGLAGRYPQANTMDEFWDNLKQGRDCIETRPLARWNEIMPAQHDDIPATRWGGFIDDMDKFDSMFFSISPKEAALLDPQERLFMQTAWEVIEDAGYTPTSLVANDSGRKVGVYVGAVWQLYQALGAEQTQAGNVQTPNSLLWSIANRVSAFMNFTGPSMAVDTACSGSLASIHLACQAIRNGDCSAAIAGGVNFDLHGSKWLLTRASGFLSPDGRCKAFSEDANGYVAGEGIGAVLLKPLQQAIEDNDNIYGVIKASSFSHGGRASGYAVPNPNAQADMISDAIDSGNLDARSINYIETHGTGTALGDPIEVRGLTNAFNRYTQDRKFCAIGSVKSNIGHLEAAAGIAGLTKILLQMRHRTLAPSLHCHVKNEAIPFEQSPFYVQTECAPWAPVEIDGKTHPLRAGLSSFGAGGANLHLIIEEPPQTNGNGGGSYPQLIPLSAHTPEQLREAAQRLSAHLKRRPPALGNLAYTLQQGRLPMQFRLGVVASSIDELCLTLENYLNSGKGESVFFADSRKSKTVATLLDSDEIEQLLSKWREQNRLDKIAQAWCQGLVTDVDLLADEGQYQKISLPTYPFAKVSHWVKAADGQQQAEVKTVLAPEKPNVLHPLIDCRDANDKAVHFLKQVDPQQYLFTDHIVADAPTLPGVAYIEMAYVSYQQSLGKKRPLRLINLVWMTPILSQKHSAIDININDETQRFEVSTTSGGKREVHAQCKFAPSNDLISIPRPLDLVQLRSRLNQHTSKEQCYDLLSQLQFRYGECLQAINGVDHNETEGLTRLVLPEPLQKDFSNYSLHPSLMDGAIQSIIAVVQNENIESVGFVPYVPFVAKTIEIHRPLTPKCFAYIRIVRGARDVDSIKKVDVTIIDEQGEVLMDIKELALKAFSLDEIKALVAGPSATPGAPTEIKAVAMPAPATHYENLYFSAEWE